MLWGLAILALLVAIPVLALGLRGRRVGDAPHCRRCDFDLSGLAQETDRCPECGGTMTGRSGRVTGKRRRRPTFIAMGVVLLVSSVGLFALALSASNSSLNAYKPTALLVFEGRLLHGPGGDAAAAELLKRHLTTPLSNDRLTRLVDPALDAQADPGVIWDQTPWWQVLDAAYMAGAVTPDQNRRYLRQALSGLDTKLPGSTLAAEPLPERTGSVSLGTKRMLTAADMRLVPAQSVGYTVALTHATLDGEPLPVLPVQIETNRGPAWEVIYLTRSVSFTSSVFSSWVGVDTVAQDTESGELTALPPMDPGEHTLALQYTVRAFAGSPSFRSGEASPDTPDAEWELQIKHAFTAYGSELDALTPVGPEDAPGFDTSCRATWSGAAVPVQRLPFGTPDTPAFGLQLTVQRNDNSLDGPWIVGRLELRHEGTTHPLRLPWAEPGSDPTVWVELGPPGRGTQGQGLNVQVDGIPRWDAVDLVIVPDLWEAAVRGCEGQVWAEPIVIAGVALDWSGVAEPSEDPPADADAPADSPDH